MTGFGKKKNNNIQSARVQQRCNHERTKSIRNYLQIPLNVGTPCRDSLLYRFIVICRKPTRILIQFIQLRNTVLMH